MTFTQVYDPITSAVSTQIIVRDEDGAFIPFDSDNVDYQAYEAWLAEGNKPNPPQAAPPIEEDPEPTIADIEEQVQDIETRLCALEGEEPSTDG